MTAKEDRDRADAAADKAADAAKPRPITLNLKLMGTFYPRGGQHSHDGKIMEARPGDAIVVSEAGADGRTVSFVVPRSLLSHVSGFDSDEKFHRGEKHAATAKHTAAETLADEKRAEAANRRAEAKDKG